MTKVLFTGYFNISILFASVKIPIIALCGQTDGKEKNGSFQRLFGIFLFSYGYKIFSSKISKENLD